MASYCEHLSCWSGAPCVLHTVREEEHLFASFKIGLHYFLDEGFIQGARYCIARPCSKKLCQQKLLVFCHGCRPQGIELQADLDLTDGMYLSLLQEGWTVAMTSYRKEGRVIMEAIEDVSLLLQYIIGKYGRQELVLLEGQSMGGHVSTLIAETRPELSHGVLTVGAALLPKAEEIYSSFNYCPQVPLLHLTTASETTNLYAYVESSRSQQCDNSIQPVCWVVQRQGHCNVNWLERFRAMRELEMWIKKRRLGEHHTLQDKRLITVPRSPLSSRVCFDEPENKSAGGAWGRVSRADVYGDIILNFQGNDLDDLGILPLRDLAITLEFESQPSIRKTVYGFRYTEGDSFCPKRGAGVWMVWENADGWIVLNRNMSAVSPINASEFLNVFGGSRIYLQSYTPKRNRLDISRIQFANNRSS